MERSRPLLNPTFINVFGCRFSSDVIDVDDIDDLLDLADTSVNDLVLRGMNIDDILYLLTESIAQWGQSVIDEFNDASNGNWSFNAEAESTLKIIVNRMIETARNRSKSIKVAE